MINLNSSMNDRKNLSKNRTDFQVYTDWKSYGFFNVVDFTEKRLLHLVDSTRDSLIKTRLAEMLSAYRQRKIAVAWQAGEPAWKTVNKG